MYWQARGYSDEDVTNVGNAVNDKLMAARVVFYGEGKLEVSVTSKTWERQEGHYPAVARFFAELAKRPKLLER